MPADHVPEAGLHLSPTPDPHTRASFRNLGRDTYATGSLQVPRLSLTALQRLPGILLMVLDEPFRIRG